MTRSENAAKSGDPAPSIGAISRVMLAWGCRTRGSRRLIRLRSVPSRQCLAEVGRQGFIGGEEFAPPRLGVAALTPGEVGLKVLDMDLVPGPVVGERVQGHAPFLEDQDRLVAVGGERDLGDQLVRRAVALG